MVTLICIVCLVICLVCFCLFRKHNNYDGYFFLGMGISGIAAIVFIIKVIGLISAVSTAYIIDDKISIYEQENSRIEASLNAIINNYSDESSISSTNESDLITRMHSIRELKSDTLIQLVVEKYLDNNKEINNLQKEQLDISKRRWELYFGK